jgi:hypothetical protein
MKFAISAIFGALAAITAVSTATPARAEVQYPWCAEYRTAVGGVNCGFETYRQCLNTISGIGGICYRNPAYFPPRERPRRR